MMRRILTISLFLVVAAGLAFAQTAKVGGEARQIALGGSNLGNGVVLNPFLSEDPSMILLNPAFQSKYANYMWWNIGGGTINGLSTGDNGYNKQNIGVSFELSKELSIGGVFSYDPTNVSSVIASLQGGTYGVGPFGVGVGRFATSPAGRGGAGLSIPAVANVWEVIGAYNTGGLGLGFGFMLGTSSSKYDTTASSGSSNISRTTEETARMFGFRLGLIMDLGGGSSFDAHGIIRLDKADDKVSISPTVANTGGEYSSSGTEIEIGARMKLRVSNHFNFTPNATFVTNSATPNEDSKPTNVTTPISYSAKFSTTALSVGVGGEYKTTNFLLAGGLSFQTISIKSEYSSTPPAVGSQTNTLSYTSIPTINVGSEWWPLDWMAVRGGYTRMLGNFSNKSEASATGVSKSGESTGSLPVSFVVAGGLGTSNWDGTVTLGLGFRFGAFSLDATVSDEALRRGLGLIGAQDNINTFGYMTMSYNFE
jgi:hypothetical protein